MQRACEGHARTRADGRVHVACPSGPRIARRACTPARRTSAASISTGRTRAVRPRGPGRRRRPCQASSQPAIQSYQDLLWPGRTKNDVRPPAHAPSYNTASLNGNGLKYCDECDEAGSTCMRAGCRLSRALDHGCSPCHVRSLPCSCSV